MRADGSGQRRLTDDPEVDPDWTPDGNRLLYLHDGRGDRPLDTINADGSARQRLGSINEVRTARWSPDDASIALTAHDAVWIVNADGSGLHRIRQSAAYPSWSPDGRQLVFIAYGSGATGPELRRMDTDGGNQVVLGVTRLTVRQSCASRCWPLAMLMASSSDAQSHRPLPSHTEGPG
jgi:Tol biopolymer transport system component